MRILITLILACVLLPSASEGKTYVLAFSGMPGSPVYANRYRDWLGRFHQHLVKKAKVPAEDIICLSGDKDFKTDFLNGASTHDEVLRALAKIARSAQPEDQFVLFIVGHGFIVEERIGLVLPGPDVTIDQLADALDAIKARNQVILNLSSIGGASIVTLASGTRVNITGNAEMEQNEPVFAEFFLLALEGRADGLTSKPDGQVTLLEAYNWATFNVAQWVARQSFDHKTFKVVGREAVRLFKKLYVGNGDGIGVRELSTKSNANAKDAIVEIGIPPKGASHEDGFDLGFWQFRRGLVEHALLEDLGEEMGVYGVKTEEDRKTFVPMTGEPGKPGHRASRVVIGKSELLPAPDQVKVPAKE